MLLICAVSPARREVVMMTPCFFPSPGLIAAMHGGPHPSFYQIQHFVTDRRYARSANLDTRSLRFRFELIVEICGRTAAENLVAHFEKQARRSRKVTLRELEARSAMARMRDAICWLFTPYL